MAAAKRGSSFLTVPLAARLLLGGVWLYAGYSKIIDVPTFAKEIANFKLIGHFVPSLRFTEPLLAIVLPWSEVVVGGMLIAGIWTRTAALISIFFQAIFAVALTTAIVRKLNISCGCFGSDSAARVGLPSLGIDAVCMVLAIIVFAATSSAKAKRAG